jgi:starvation-inducible DNA-binding protein
VARSARGMFPIAHKAKGEPTCDLPTQRRDSHDKAAWMPRSLLEE